MKTLPFVAVALVLTALLASSQRGFADAPADTTQLKAAPPITQADSAPSANPALPTGFFGLSMSQILTLAAVFAVFICLAVVMRWWLSPREPEDAEATPNSGLPE